MLHALFRICNVKFEKVCSSGQEKKCETVYDTINKQECKTTMQRKCEESSECGSNHGKEQW